MESILERRLVEMLGQVVMLLCAVMFERGSLLLCVHCLDVHSFCASLINPILHSVLCFINISKRVCIENQLESSV